MSGSRFAEGWARPPRAASGQRLAELEEALATAPLFADVPKRHLRSLARVTRVSTHPVNAEIVREGTEGQTLYVIMEGSARVVKGRRRLARLGPGDFFGELAIFDGEPRTASVIAEEPVQCVKLEGADFRKLLLREPRLGLAIMTGLARRLRAS